MLAKVLMGILGEREAQPKSQGDWIHGNTGTEGVWGRGFSEMIGVIREVGREVGAEIDHKNCYHG